MREGLSFLKFTLSDGGSGGDGDDDGGITHTHIFRAQKNRMSLIIWKRTVHIHKFFFLHSQCETIKMSKHQHNWANAVCMCVRCFDFSCRSSLKLGIVILQCHVWWQKKQPCYLCQTMIISQWLCVCVWFFSTLWKLPMAKENRRKQNTHAKKTSMRIRWMREATRCSAYLRLCAIETNRDQKIKLQ